MAKKQRITNIHGTEIAAVNKKIDRMSPLSWRAEVEVDETNVSVMIKYLPHHKIDDSQKPKEKAVSYLFNKKEMIGAIPDGIFENPGGIVNYLKRLDDIKWEYREKITDMLCDDFADLQSKERDTYNMYLALMQSFSGSKKYDEILSVYATIEGILKLFRQPKAFYGHDIRDAM